MSDSDKKSLPTPRAWEDEEQCRDCGMSFCSVELTRQLERELAEERLKRVEAQAAQLKAERELAEATADLSKEIENHSADLNEILARSAERSNALEELDRRVGALRLKYGADPNETLEGFIERLASRSSEHISATVPKEHHDRILRAIDGALDEIGAPVSGEWEGISTKLSRVGRILRLTTASEQPTSVAAGSTKAVQGDDSHREGLATASHERTIAAWKEEELVWSDMNDRLRVALAKIANFEFQAGKEVETMRAIANDALAGYAPASAIRRPE